MRGVSRDGNFPVRTNSYKLWIPHSKRCRRNFGEPQRMPKRSISANHSASDSSSVCLSPLYGCVAAGCASAPDSRPPSVHRPTSTSCRSTPRRLRSTPPRMGRAPRRCAPAHWPAGAGTPPCPHHPSPPPHCYWSVDQSHCRMSSSLRLRSTRCRLGLCKPNRTTGGLRPSR